MMMKKLKMKILRVIEAERDILALDGMTIRKGTIYAVTSEGPKHPKDGHRVVSVRIDNGTGDWELCPETAIRIDEDYDETGNMSKCQRCGGEALLEPNENQMYGDVCVKCNHWVCQDCLDHVYMAAIESEDNICIDCAKKIFEECNNCEYANLCDDKRSFPNCEKLKEKV